MGKQVKFASQIDARVLKELREFAKESDRTLSGVLTRAVDEFLQRARVRPAFRKAGEDVLDEHDDLLRRLAK
jgi:predicted transcriptional regulator